jgi:hypothetical protein
LLEGIIEDEGTLVDQIKEKSEQIELVGIQHFLSISVEDSDVLESYYTQNMPLLH